MPNCPRSLAAGLSWEAVLQRLEIELPTLRVLPARVPCPLCRTGNLRLLDDDILGGCWTDCAACGFAGDLIELTAAVRQVAPAAAILYLQMARLFSIPVDAEQQEAYLDGHVAYRRRLREFWSDAKRRLVEGASPESMALLEALGIASCLQESRSSERMGDLLGLADPQSVEELFAPESYRCNLRLNQNGRRTLRKGGGPGRRRTFRGKAHLGLAVMAHYDLPGRICGFLLLVWTPATGAVETIFRRANFGAGRSPREAGLAGLASLNSRPPANLPPTAVILPDPISALWLQALHLRCHPDPLPLVVPFFSPQAQTLRIPPVAEARRIYCIGSDPRLWRLAIQVEAAILPEDPPRFEQRQRAFDYTPDNWVRHVNRKARPWREVVLEALDPRNPAEAEGLIAALGLTNADLDRLLCGAAPERRQQILLPVGGLHGIRTAQVRGRRIEETASGWRIVGQNESICNFCPRVAEMHYLSDGSVVYALTVRCNDDVTGITAPGTKSNGGACCAASPTNASAANSPPSGISEAGIATP